MNNIQIQAFIKSLKKTKGRLTNEKTKHMDKTTNSDCGYVHPIVANSFIQDKFDNKTIRVGERKSKVIK